MSPPYSLKHGAEISGEVSQRSVPVVENPKSHAMWEDIGQILKKYSAPIVWNFPSEQIQNPGKSRISKRKLQWQLQRGATDCTVLGPGECLLHAGHY